MSVRRTVSTEEQRMSDSKTVTIDNPTKKAIVVGIAALCLCVVGALLVVGRGSGGMSFADAARAATQQPSGGPTQSGGSGVWGQNNGSQDGQGSGDDGSGGLRGSASLDEFRQCLQDKGVTLPDPAARGQAQRPELSDTLRQAFEACRQYLPDRPSRGGVGGPGDGSAPPGMTPPGQDGQSGGDQTDDSTF